MPDDGGPLRFDGGIPSLPGLQLPTQFPLPVPNTRSRHLAHRWSQTQNKLTVGIGSAVG